MAVYAINREGIEALENLKNELKSAVNDIYDASDRVLKEIDGLEEGLGIFDEEIKHEVKETLKILRNSLTGDDGVGVLINKKIPEVITVYEMIINEGLGGNEEPQKVKSLYRR